MPTVALTATFVRAAHCPPGRKKVDYFDLTQRGFMVEVRCSGGATYYQRYTDERGRQRQYKSRRAQSRAGAPQRPPDLRRGAAWRGSAAAAARNARRAAAHPFRARALSAVRADRQEQLAADETVLRVHILPRLGTLALDEIKTDAISDLINRMRADGYAAGTMNRVIVILRCSTILPASGRCRASATIRRPA